MKKILGMGNALVDILIELEHDNLLTTFQLPNGSMQLIDHPQALTIDKYTSELPKTLATKSLPLTPTTLLATPKDW